VAGQSCLELGRGPCPLVDRSTYEQSLSPSSESVSACGLWVHGGKEVVPTSAPLSSLSPNLLRFIVASYLSRGPILPFIRAWDKVEAKRNEVERRSRYKVVSFRFELDGHGNTRLLKLQPEVAVPAGNYDMSLYVKREAVAERETGQ